MLIVLGGLPATGKSTVSRGVAQAIGAIYLRIDTIEQSMRDAGVVTGDIGPAGYLVGYHVALDNLQLGLSVVADSVNPLAITRDAWRQVGEQAGVPVLEVEVICSDAVEHQRRVATRTSDIAGLQLPSWAQVIHRAYDPWDRERLILDTAGSSSDESVRQAIALIRSHQ